MDTNSPHAANISVVGAVSVDEAGFLSQDVYCRRCNYNLHGLKADGLCPECGIAVGLSTQGNLLRFADPDWLGKVLKGTRLILWGILAAMVGSCAGQLVGAAANNVALGGFIVLAASAIALWGTWLLTEKDPRSVGEDRWEKARQFVRFSIVASLIGNFFAILMEAMSLPSAFELIFQVLAWILIILGAIGQIAELHYIGSLATRMPNEFLAKRASFVGWAMGIFSVGTAIGGVLVMVGMFWSSNPATPHPLVAVGTIVAGIFGLGYLVFSLAALLTLNRFRKELTSIVAAAQSTYSQPVQPQSPR